MMFKVLEQEDTESLTAPRDAGQTGITQQALV